MVIPDGPSPRWPAEMEAEYGADSPFYRSRVLAEFPTEATEALIRRSWIDQAQELWRAQDAWGWVGHCTLGIDVARHGPDATCCAIHQHGAVRTLITWRGADSTESVDRVERETAAIGAQRPTVVVDATGLGW